MQQIFQYRLAGLSSSVFVGKHASQWVQNGQLFKRHAPFTAHADPRRIDLRASVLDPFEQYQVRTYQQHSLTHVYFIADLSASFSFVGEQAKQDCLQQLLLTIAYSALAVGDYFGFIGCGRYLETRWILPSLRHIGRITEFAKQLRTAKPSPDCASLAQIAPHLPKQRALVFLLSDFHVPLLSLPNLLHALKPHDVVPLVLWDRQEYQQLPAWGLVSYQDMENSTTRTLWMRPSLQQKIFAAYQQRQQQLQNSLRALGHEPLFLNTQPVAEQLNHYFRQRNRR
jgi:uncharacterized protein (DUF58 family)